MANSVDALLAYFKQAQLLLSALVAGGVVKTEAGTEIAGILDAVTAVIQGAKDPTPAEVQAVVNLFAELKNTNMVGGKMMDEIATGLGEYEAFVTSVTNNQVAVIRGNASLFGVKGIYAFIPAASEQGKSLGLS